ncbi:MAG: thiamine pyrophosphate-binding protein [Chthoniobacterales bacterium]
MKLSDYVLQFVADQGVKHVFLLPGGGAMHLNDSLGGCAGVDYVCNLHEQACAIAAEAYARVTNNLGVAMVTAGPGGTNTVTGVAAAWLDSTPVLFLSGQAKRADLKGQRGLRQLGVQEIDLVTIVSSITKYAVTVLEPEKIRYHLEKAAHLARSGRPGPVWLDLPLDVQAANIDPENLVRFDPSESPAASAEITEGNLTAILKLLNESERPVILAGNGVRIAGVDGLFLEAAEKMGVPVLTTRLGVDLIPADHPLCFGMPGGIASRGANFTLQNSDFLLILGARLDMALIAYAPGCLARGARKVMVNIDEAEIRKLGAIIDIGVSSDAKVFLEALMQRSTEIEERARTSWLDRCRGWQSRYPFVTAEQREQADGINTYAFSEILSQEAAEGDIVLPGSSGLACEIFLTAFKAKKGQRIFHNKGTGAMGLAQPAAIGACLASGGRRTLCIDGDGGFLMNIQELETVRRLNLPIKFFVINNDCYASIRASQTNYFKRLVAADTTSGLSLPDLGQVAKAFGLEATRVSQPSALREEIRRVLQTHGPSICEIMVLPAEPRIPSVRSMQRADGSMVSKPLEDLFPFLDRDEFRSNMIVTPLQE